ncbi:MAG TPA: class I SAM-dependent methyltransferase [Pseudomonadales bacterium]|nr:class I SAM-dependent methyltransferase [Pseudomonadales bacterium]
MDVIEHNRLAWDRESAAGGPWSIPVDAATIARARAGDWSVILTPTVPVPRAWFGDLGGAEVLGLASAGGQQMPVLAAAGARVTSFDLSAEQLARDREVAEREGLPLRCVRGNMQDLSVFAAASFDLVFHPVSNLFVPDLAPVWAECARVLRPGGRLLAGFCNPAWFQCDEDAPAPVLCFRPPYREPDSLGPEAEAAWRARGEQAIFAHGLEDQIGGQLAAGLRIDGFFEDAWPGVDWPLSGWVPAAYATLAVRLP